MRGERVMGIGVGNLQGFLGNVGVDGESRSGGSFDYRSGRRTRARGATGRGQVRRGNICGAERQGLGRKDLVDQQRPGKKQQKADY